MSTINFDRISIELAQRINDPVATAATDGNILTADLRTSFVNKALHKLFNDMWVAVQGDKKKFVEIFPEMTADNLIITDSNGLFTVASPILNFFTIIDGLKVTGNIYIPAIDDYFWNIVKSGANEDYVYTAAEPAVIEHNRILYFFPASDYASKSIAINYIKMPLDPATGAFLTQGGTTDSPFYPHWNSRIAEIAEELFRISAQDRS